MVYMPQFGPVTVEGEVEDCYVTEDRFHCMLLGGDQLTAARARGAQRIRSNSERSLDRLEGFEPTSEDWHAKGILLAVCINYLCACDYICSLGRLPIVGQDMVAFLKT